MKSVILKYMNENIAWRHDISEKGIKISDDGPYTLLKYNALDVDWNDPICREARGIIIKNADYSNRKVVALAYNKFFNIQESYAANIDWTTARVQEKVDGSLIKLFFDDNKWHFSTNGTIDAAKAQVANHNMSFMDVIKLAINYKDINFNSLDPNYTYVLELVSPLTQIVINYPVTKLYHTGTRNNITGEEVNMNIGIQKPKEYPLHNLNDCLTAVSALNADSAENDPRFEGFVVVDSHWNRVKIKTPEYVSMHYLRTNGNISESTALDMIQNKEDSGYKTALKVPKSRAILAWYEYQSALLEYKVDEYITYVRGLYEEYDHDRKAVALKIKKDKLSVFGFKSINNKMSAKELIMSVPRSTVEKFIDEWKGV